MRERPICAREAMLPRTRSLLHRSHDLVGVADLCERVQSVHTSDHTSLALGQSC